MNFMTEQQAWKTASQIYLDYLDGKREDIGSAIEQAILKAYEDGCDNYKGQDEYCELILERDTLKAENGKFRTALEKIAGCVCTCRDEEIAREALGREN